MNTPRFSIAVVELMNHLYALTLVKTGIGISQPADDE